MFSGLATTKLFYSILSLSLFLSLSPNLLLQHSVPVKILMKKKKNVEKKKGERSKRKIRPRNNALTIHWLGIKARGYNIFRLRIGVGHASIIESHASEYQNPSS